MKNTVSIAIVVFLVSTLSACCPPMAPREAPVLKQAVSRMQEDTHYKDQIQMACNSQDVQFFWSDFSTASKQKWCGQTWEDSVASTAEVCTNPDTAKKCALYRDKFIEVCSEILTSIAKDKAACPVIQ